MFATPRRKAAVISAEVFNSAKVFPLTFSSSSAATRFSAHWICVCLGNLTAVIQKRLMIFINVSNSLNCTGLQR